MESVERKNEIKVIGISTRTCNRDEGLPGQSRIGRLWTKFYQEAIAQRIPGVVNPGIVLAVYSDYESDMNGMYTLTIGCEVKSLDRVPEGMHGSVIPAGKYARFPTPRGPLPGIIIEGWKQVWKSGANRAYTSDFECYDQRALNPQDAEADLYISIR